MVATPVVASIGYGIVTSLCCTPAANIACQLYLIKKEKSLEGCTKYRGYLLLFG